MFEPNESFMEDMFDDNGDDFDDDSDWDDCERDGDYYDYELDDFDDLNYDRQDIESDLLDEF